MKSKISRERKPYNTASKPFGVQYEMEVPINHYGGKIWAESELGHGSTFIFVLPA